MKLNKILSATMCLLMLLSVGCASKEKVIDTSSNAKQVAKVDVAKVEEPKRNINVETAIKYIQAKDYEGAYTNLRGFENSNDEEGKNLLHYVLALRHFRPLMGETKGEYNVYSVIGELKKINPSYKGALSSEIKSLVSAIDANPKIGMSTYEVLLSKWGNPNKINRTTTANSVKEQWVYYGNKYLYLENDKVTAIQE